ncbi:uncharacterized protein BCR38DRAFT_77706 [Pseudomassariella vexata]|uniref:Uncharacterized protein n=1 Tax=Pseudomassariella vexata TaxID=1141098 RepID=A0A1Y2DFV7_9PEZI|nr:uncharacterized protein BCR38DRAFT_77706 [Pseudomassariella vexata]ORY58172.1 hypothetical protein BCR38DRAFT_77706 [Pseudomassariella vexata]
MAHARQVRQDLQAQAQAAVHAGAAPLLFEARPPGMRPLGPPPPAHQPHDEVNLPKHWAERRERRYAKLHEIEVKMREMREGPRRRLANPAKPPDPNPQSNLHRTQSAPERVLGNLNPQPAPFQHAQVEAALRNGDVFFGMQNADLPAIVPFSNVNNFQGFPEVRLFGLLNDGPYGQEDDPWMEEMRRSVADIRRNIAQRVQIPEMPQMPQMPQMPHLQHMPPIPQIPMVGVGPRPPVPVRAHHPHRVEIRNRAGNPQGPHAAFGRARN